MVATEGTFSYRDLLHASARVAACLLAGRDDLAEARVAFLAPPSFAYVATQWGIWRAGGIAVPLAVSHPPPELEYVIRDADADVVVVHPDFATAVQAVRLPSNTRTLTTTAAERTAPRSPLPAVAEGRRALMVYTSGTTGRPKGVVTTHANITAQVVSLVTAWEWRADDAILLVLPLHHVHGIINVLACALWAGARCEMLPRFEGEQVWSRIARSDLTLFMAVPT
ncbi:MAG TPA: AMP-binding protein, partial [Gemmatimonadales bacterium]|nr:AMP-binding protein [Gemmatimonadales bacterium]